MGRGLPANKTLLEGHEPEPWPNAARSPQGLDQNNLRLE